MVLHSLSKLLSNGFMLMESAVCSASACFPKWCTHTSILVRVSLECCNSNCLISFQYMVSEHVMILTVLLGF